MLEAYIVPLKADWRSDAGHVLFLNTEYRYDIFESTYLNKNVPPSQIKIGYIPVEKDMVEAITQWCYAHFKSCPAHPAVLKLDLENHTTQLMYTDKYIEDFVDKHYDEIMEKLNARN